MRNKKHQTGSERGAALVIAIFSLMLISVVATSLILTSDTQTAVKSNYKSAMRAFYAAKAGLEEARGRLWTGNPDSAAVLACISAGGPTMAPGNACYITNPPGQNVDPRNTATSNPYADLEFQQEWPTAPPADAQLIASTSPNAGIAGPLYNWVRITARTEASGGFAIDGVSQPDAVNPLFFDGAHPLPPAGGQVPGTPQVLTITSLAVTPSGSRRMLQYSVVAPVIGTALPTFPAAVTLDGNGVTIPSANGTIGGSSDVHVNGNDSNPNPPPGTPPGVPAIGYINSNDASAVTKAASPATDYLSPQNIPPVGNVSGLLSSLLQTPGGLDGLVQSITRGADLVLNPPSGTTADQTSLTGMSAANPMVVVVNGDFHLSHGSSSFTGYGLLLVTGTLRYDPDTSWNGIILVIGKGVFDGSQHGNNGQINGAVLVANTRDSSGNLLTNLGPASFNLTGGGQGIHYNSQLVTSTEATMTYQVLSFREIQQTTP